MVDHIALEGVETHNLKEIDVQIPHKALTVISGVSGSGKSSLAFDTLYAEGQRRFTESLSTYARQFLRQMEKPPIRKVHNILPAVALRQKNSITHARSTVATLTEIADHLQLVYTHVGVTTCPECQKVVRRDTVASVAEALNALGQGRRLIFLADVNVLEVQTPQQVLSALTAEGYQRLYLNGETVQLTDVDVEALLDRKSFPVVIDRLKTATGELMRLREAIEHAFELGDGHLRVLDVTERGAEPVEHHFDRRFACNGCQKTFIEPLPALFSYNSPIGACPECSGFGKTAATDPKKIIPNEGLTLKQGAVSVFETESRVAHKRKFLKKMAEEGVPVDVPYGELSEAQRDLVLYGKGRYKGVMGFFDRMRAKRNKPYARVLLARYRGYTRCPSCDGSRFSAEARAVAVGGHTIAQFYGLRVGEALELIESFDLAQQDRERVAPLLEEIVSRLRYLNHVGLGYLHLTRQSRTLSGGEVQRIQLTSSLGRTLTDTLYVLDEPTAGLHARDTLRLMEVLEQLRDIGNAVVVVEHDPDMILGADWAIELGPMGGERGGQLLFQGDAAALRASETPTGKALGQRNLTGMAFEGSPRFDPERDAHFKIVGASENNLRDVTVAIPVGRLTCVTGVSGSGKTSLVHRCLYDSARRAKGLGGVEATQVREVEGLGLFQDIILMEQGGLGRSSRSTVASYAKAWDGIRKLFGKLKASQERGLGAASFSFNTAGGRCEKCEGTGRQVIEMHFMADIEIVCDECQGHRFVNKVLEVRHRGKNISDVLKMTVKEAMSFFEGQRAITNRLSALMEVGLGYLRIGQTTSTLSGGEAQRLLLASYLGQKKFQRDGGLLFIFDEPTIGLHLQDIDVLLRALRRTIDEGHTVLVVEHNIDFIACADHVIDLGPEGGDGGGEVVAEGTPEDVAGVEASWTGRHLRELLEQL